MNDTTLDYHLVSDTPAPLFMGEIPDAYDRVPARVAVNLCGMFPFPSPTTIVLAFPMYDTLEIELVPSREDIERFLAVTHIYAENEATYWHCQAGLNRSGICVAAYLHLYRSVPIGEAIALLRTRRHESVLCNTLFERLLHEWYGAAAEKPQESPSVAGWLSRRLGR